MSTTYLSNIKLQIPNALYAWHPDSSSLCSPLVVGVGMHSNPSQPQHWIQIAWTKSDGTYKKHSQPQFIVWKNPMGPSKNKTKSSEQHPLIQISCATHATSLAFVWSDQHQCEQLPPATCPFSTWYALELVPPSANETQTCLTDFNSKKQFSNKNLASGFSSLSCFCSWISIFSSTSVSGSWTSWTTRAKRSSNKLLRFGAEEAGWTSSNSSGVAGGSCIINHHHS